MYKYPIATPNVNTGNELKYVTEAIRTNWVSWRGRFIKEFEEKFAKRHGAKYGVTTTSGTTALTLAVASIAEEGDEVIVPEFTMVASAWAVSYNNVKPVFVDCKDDLTVDTDLIESKVTERTKAIMPVHIYGRQCEMGKVKEIADKYKLKVIEDSALNHGVSLKGDVACYAFFANKIMTAGEGGICITNDEKLAERMEYLRNMAFDPKHTFLHKEIGFNFRMTNLQAAVLLAQLERLDEFLQKRKQIEGWYNEELKNVPQITLMPSREGVWVYDILAEDKQGLMDYLEEEGVETRNFFKPMSMQPMYLNDYSYLKAYDFSEKGLYLPVYTRLEQKDIQYICERIREYYRKRSS